MKFVHNKKFLLILLILNLIGIIFAFKTYLNEIVLHFNEGRIWIIPFFMISVWLFLFAFIIVFYMYFRKRIPVFLGSLSFIFCFVFGFGSVLFYPLFMAFVRGITPYHVWNIFAHAFVGLQALIFLTVIRKPKISSAIFLACVFIFLDVLYIFFGGFLYFVNFDIPIILKQILIVLVVALQISAFYLLLAKKKSKRLK